VPLDRALSYGFVVAMILGHALMHGGHGSHSAHTRASQMELQGKDSSVSERGPTSPGGCH
jgi:hypothetical protein